MNGKETKETSAGYEKSDLTESRGGNGGNPANNLRNGADSGADNDGGFAAADKYTKSLFQKIDPNFHKIDPKAGSSSTKNLENAEENIEENIKDDAKKSAAAGADALPKEDLADSDFLSISKMLSDKHMADIVDISKRIYKKERTADAEAAERIQNERGEEPTRNGENGAGENEKIFSNALFSASLLPREVFSDDYYTRVNSSKCYKMPLLSTNADLKNVCENRKDLESLIVSDCNLIYDFSCLENMENLLELDLRNCQLFNNEQMKYLTKLRNLRVLNLSASSVTDIGAVKYMENLQVINCSACKLTDISVIVGCKKLVEAVFWGCMTLSDADALERCEKLRCLDLEFTGITDLFPLVNCKKLELLNLDNCDRLKEFSTLSALT
ncbi:MAG: hypothetical protein LBB09_00530, partial [Rickettsiales bacterium]|nr:hypothetical protein [Rickettsiales bacterium]